MLTMPFPPAVNPPMFVIKVSSCGANVFFIQPGSKMDTIVSTIKARDDMVAFLRIFYFGVPSLFTHSVNIVVLEEPDLLVYPIIK